MNFSGKQLIVLVLVLVAAIAGTILTWDFNHPQGTVVAAGCIYENPDGEVIVVGRSYADIVVTAIPDYHGG